VDVVQAETQVLSAQADAIDLRVSRSQLEHAIAVLTGRAPANFDLPPEPFRVHIPEVPPGLPSTLLERRPDIAAAERRMAAANERIGIAQAAYYPNLSLTGSAGFSSNSLSNLFSAPSRFWSIGADLGRHAPRFRRAFGAGRSLARAVRRDRRELPADRAHRLPGGRGQPLGGALVRGGNEGAGRGDARRA
jgi:outer membrane protein TolC